MKIANFDEHDIIECAKYLWKQIQHSNTARPLPDSISADSLCQGQEEIPETVQSFFFSCFTYRNFSSVNKARPDIFDEKFDVKPWEDLTHIFPHVKGISPSSLPPCQIVLINKIKRANFVAAIWKNAVLRRHPGWKPEDHGWKKSGNSLIIMWFEGDQVPQSVEDILL